MVVVVVILPWVAIIRHGEMACSFLSEHYRDLASIRVCGMKAQDCGRCLLFPSQSELCK